MRSAEPYIPTVKISPKELKAPIVLVAVYGLLSLFNSDSLSALNLVLAALAYQTVHWWCSISYMVQDAFEQVSYERLFDGLGIALFAVASIALSLIFDAKIIVQRFFTVGPIFLGLLWIVFRNVKEVVNTRTIWNWWKLKSPKHSSFAACIYGSALMIRGGLNELFLAVDIDLVWIISCAVLPIITRWCSDTAIVRGLVRRGAVYRRLGSLNDG
ncbi:MAG: hypothetical protein ABJD13_04330 [Paracoccaceae bacterium]